MSAVEEENLSLRLQLNNQALTHSALSASDDEDDDETNKTERDTMREKISELTRQKMQLSEHIAMVAAENRQLWSRLSKLTKENETLEKLTEQQSSPTHQNNLIRSKTFTQNSPNPKLREKFDKNSDPETLIVDVAKFAISENYGTGGEIEGVRKLLDEMGDAKTELMRQQTVLKSALTTLKEKKATAVCRKCALAQKDSTGSVPVQSKPKRLEEPPLTPLNGTSGFIDVILNNDRNKPIDFLDEKRKADAIDRLCPMCGKLYKTDCLFEEFQEHVESHFIDTDADLTIDNDRFELITHTVGNF